jgi:hypothetical protein
VTRKFDGRCPLLCGHRHQSKSRDNRVFNPLDVGQVVRVIRRYQLCGEEPIRRPHRVAAPCLRRAVQAGEVGRSVGLGGHQLEPLLLRLPLVQQVLLVNPLLVLDILGGRPVVADRAQQDRKRGQSLLPIYDQKLLHSGRPVGRARRQHEGADEVGGLRLRGAVLGELSDVFPQTLELYLRPRVCSLVQRNLVLL